MKHREAISLQSLFQKATYAQSQQVIGLSANNAGIRGWDKQRVNKNHDHVSRLLARLALSHPLPSRYRWPLFVISTVRSGSSIAAWETHPILYYKAQPSIP